MSPSSMQQQVESQLLASYESLYRLAYTYVKNPDDAMDVVQESAFKAISRSADVRSPAAIRGWLCRIVVNTATDVLRAGPVRLTRNTSPRPVRRMSIRTRI